MRISDWSSDVCSSDLSSPPPAADGAIISAPPQRSSCSPAGDFTTITCVSHTALLKRAPGLSVIAIVSISLPFSECADFKSDAGRETRPLAGDAPHARPPIRCGLFRIAGYAAAIYRQTLSPGESPSADDRKNGGE